LPVAICANAPGGHVQFEAADYDLSATLDSGQAFRWERRSSGWEGILGRRWVRLTSLPCTISNSPSFLTRDLDLDLDLTLPKGERDQDQEHDHDQEQEKRAAIRPPCSQVRLTEGRGQITAETAEPVTDWNWLTDYLQLHVPLHEILLEFPNDEPMRAAVQACRGLRLLRQDPWECLASFILSSTKQIVQIRQIVAQVCACFGEPVKTPAGQPQARSFTAAARLAEATEAELRACKMGFRAPYLRQTAIAVARGEPDLASLVNLDTDAARDQLLRFPGVGRKIADCVLLFAYGRQDAFPVDVWVTKALRQLYFRGRRVHPKRLQRFAQTHFGPYAGYAQQYLFHYMRTRRLLSKS
jgi:N-glycosylase/DNA lyase